MDHNMVLSYEYAKQKRRRRQTNVLPLQAILMAMRRHWSNSCSIAQWRMSRAISKATGCRHRATSCSVLLPRTPGLTINHTTMNKYTYFAVRFDGHRDAAVQYCAIAKWRGSRTSLEATGCHHRASTCSDTHQSDMPTPVFPTFFIVKSSKKATKHKDSPK